MPAYQFALSEPVGIGEPGYFPADQTTVKRDCAAANEYLDNIGIQKERRILVKPSTCALCIIVDRELTVDEVAELEDTLNKCELEEGGYNLYSLRETRP